MRRTLALLIAVGVGGFGLIAWWAYTAPGINQATADRLPGLTLKEAEVLIGMPPGDYTTLRVSRSFSPLRSPLDDRHCWESDAGFLQTTLNSDGKIVVSLFIPYPESFINKVKRLLGFYEPTKAWTR